MSDFFKRVSSAGHQKELSEDIKSVETQMSLLNHSFDTGDKLRVSNSLLATSRVAGALSRQVFIEDLANWSGTLETITKAELKNFTRNFNLMLEREHEKHRFETKLTAIQNTADSGFYPREWIAKKLRELASSVDAGDYSTLLPKTDSLEEVQAKVDQMNKARGA